MLDLEYIFMKYIYTLPFIQCQLGCASAPSDPEWIDEWMHDKTLNIIRAFD